MEGGRDGNITHTTTPTHKRTSNKGIDHVLEQRVDLLERDKLVTKQETREGGREGYVPATNAFATFLSKRWISSGGTSS